MERCLRRIVLPTGGLPRTRPGRCPACRAPYEAGQGRSMRYAQFVARFCDTYNIVAVFNTLILSLPTRNSTLRMRVWRALKECGAAVLRDGVYLLPANAAH